MPSELRPLDRSLYILSAAAAVAAAAAMDADADEEPRVDLFR